MQKFYAILSVFSAGARAILAKIGSKGISGNLANGPRTVVILFVAWGIILVSGEEGELKSLTKNNLLFLRLAAIATGLSLIFYFTALETGKVTKFAPIHKLSFATPVGMAFSILKDPIENDTLIRATLTVP